MASGGRPPKSAKLIVLEGKTHLTKEEIAKRKAAEAATLTGVVMRAPTNLDEDEKKVFYDVRDLFKLIDKDDAIYNNVIARYAQLKIECEKTSKAIKACEKDLLELQLQYYNCTDSEKAMDFLTYQDYMDRIRKNINALERQRHQKRQMLFAIEKENIMTVASALRSVPKKVPKKDKATGMGKFTGKHKTEDD